MAYDKDTTATTKLADSDLNYIFTPAVMHLLLLLNNINAKIKEEKSFTYVLAQTSHSCTPWQ